MRCISEYSLKITNTIYLQSISTRSPVRYFSVNFSKWHSFKFKNSKILNLMGIRWTREKNVKKRDQKGRKESNRIIIHWRRYGTVFRNHKSLNIYIYNSFVCVAFTTWISSQVLKEKNLFLRFHNEKLRERFFLTFYNIFRAQNQWKFIF